MWWLGDIVRASISIVIEHSPLWLFCLPAVMNGPLKWSAQGLIVGPAPSYRANILATLGWGLFGILRETQIFTHCTFCLIEVLNFNLQFFEDKKIDLKKMCYWTAAYLSAPNFVIKEPEQHWAMGHMWLPGGGSGPSPGSDVGSTAGVMRHLQRNPSGI